MRTKLNLQSKDENLYLPERAKVTKIREFTPKEKYFEFELLDRKMLGNVPCQFLQVSIPGIGEAPISITSAPRNDNKFEMSVRALGDVTNKLHQLKVGDIIYIRGPFGNGFPKDKMEKLEGKHLLIIMGGIGYFPARSLINTVINQKDKYKKITILSGTKTPQERMYPEELAAIAKMGGNIELLETVDKPEPSWSGYVGVITTLIPKVNFDPNQTVAFMVGPPIMYKFVLKSLLERQLPKANIYMDMERRMKCGVGKCGHCQMEGIYVCQEGPVFNYAEVENNEEVF